jgi:translin
MSYIEVERSLASTTKLLDEVVARREKLIKESRDVISLCSKTIVSIHTLDFKEARRLHQLARRQLSRLRRIARSDLTRYLMTPEQEFVEASVMFSIRAKKGIPSLSKLGVLPSSYLLGLLDAIGELKRTVYDSIRRGDLKTAEQMFSTMESLYVMISPFAVYDNTVQSLRRKLDIARMLIEDTRATVTEEVRRLEFMEAVNKLASKLGGSGESFAEIRNPNSSYSKSHQIQPREPESPSASAESEQDEDSA